MSPPRPHDFYSKFTALESPAVGVDAAIVFQEVHVPVSEEPPQVDWMARDVRASHPELRNPWMQVGSRRSLGLTSRTVLGV